MLMPRQDVQHWLGCSLFANKSIQIISLIWNLSNNDLYELKSLSHQSALVNGHRPPKKSGQNQDILSFFWHQVTCTVVSVSQNMWRWISGLPTSGLATWWAILRWAILTSISVIRIAHLNYNTFFQSVCLFQGCGYRFWLFLHKDIDREVQLVL